MLCFHSKFACLLSTVFLAAALSIGTSLPACADEETAAEVSTVESEHPVVAEVRKQLGDRSPTKPFVMIVDLVAKDGKGKDIIAAMTEATPPTRKEEANVRYQLLRDLADKNRFQIAEQWKNLDGLASHLEQPYIVKLLAQFDEALAQPPEVKVLIPVWLKKK